MLFLNSLILLLSMPGGTEWILIILAVLILFGGRKIPEFMRGIGRGIREFNDAKSNVKKEIEDGMNDKENKTSSTTTTTPTH
ncbi:MAG TPA: twin-arginine translocase TatA/TatE family subunit [Chitinophagaceae bacterium]|nr:twin-arginine translocase TatA/TatE family subunit [Chitinophagaceae bacterium]